MNLKYCNVCQFAWVHVSLLQMDVFFRYENTPTQYTTVLFLFFVVVVFAVKIADNFQMKNCDILF